MAVQNDPLQISPYTSSVPLVQIPPEKIEAQTRPAAPLAGEFGKKGTGALAIGDALMKGFLAGHQQKEQRKSQAAQAEYASGSAQIAAAKATYQQAVDSGQAKPNDPNDPAFQAYQKAVAPILAQLQPLTVPQKPQKGEKKTAKEEVKGFGEGIKGFLAANQHIIPSLAMLAMTPQPVGKSPQGQAQNLELARQQQVLAEGNVEASESKRKQDAEKTYDLYSGLNEAELAALPREEQQKFQAARNIIFQQHGSTGVKEYASPDGLHRDWFLPGQQPGGWEATQGTSSGQPKIGTEGEFTAQAYKKYGVTAQNATPELSKYIHDWWQWKAAQNTSSTSGTTVDIHGNRTTTNAATRGTPEPKPPAGFQPIEDPDRQAGGITPPPQQAGGAPSGGISRPPAAPKTASAPGRIAAPPKPTLTDANRTEKVETEKATRYQNAENKYRAQLKTLETQLAGGKIDQASYEKLKTQAATDLESDKTEVGKWYAQQVHAAGGRMPNDLPEEAKKLLKVGFVTTFGNGQEWTLDASGQPKQVK